MKVATFVPLLGLALLLPAGLLHAIPLPDNSSVADPATAFAITNTGTGGAGKFEINNGANSKDALTAVTNGTGKAGFFQVNNAANNTYALQAQSNGPGIALYGYNTGTGRGGVMEINNAANTNIALYGYTNGKGQAGLFQINNAANPKEAMRAVTNGTGVAVYGVMNGRGKAGVFQLNSPTSVNNGVEVSNNGLGWSVFSQNTGVLLNQNQQPVGGSGAGWFEIAQAQNPADALFSKTNGTGYAVKGINTGFIQAGDFSFAGGGGWFETNNAQNNRPTLVVRSDGLGSGETIDLTNANSAATALVINNGGGGGGLDVTAHSASSPVALFSNYDPSSGVSTVRAYTEGPGDAVNAITIGNGNAVRGETAGTGYAGVFMGTSSSSNGVYASAPVGFFGLNVVSGTKAGIVPTSGGARALYSEESSEVWFTDYGFGQLKKGRAFIPIETTFAETVNLTEPYHVFLQAYGMSDLAVTKRTATGFEVRLREGDPNVEFSFRIVGKRRGYEQTRLQRAPQADSDPNLLAAKQAFGIHSSEQIAQK